MGPSSPGRGRIKQSASITSRSAFASAGFRAAEVLLEVFGFEVCAAKCEPASAMTTARMPTRRFIVAEPPDTGRESHATTQRLRPALLTNVDDPVLERL